MYDSISTHTSRECGVSHRVLYRILYHFNSRFLQDATFADNFICFIYFISTHVPHKRYDISVLEDYFKKWSFQLTYLIRGTTCRSSTCCRKVSFQLTYLIRGTTGLKIKGGTNSSDISTRVPHKRYDWHSGLVDRVMSISTHVPHKRYDIHLHHSNLLLAFQLTYLIRGTTQIFM